jgi:hypothetical protein
MGESVAGVKGELYDVHGHQLVSLVRKRGEVTDRFGAEWEAS